MKSSSESSRCSAGECAGQGRKLCGSCGRISYCNSVCQKRHWKVHKNMCCKRMTDELLSFDKVLLGISDLTKIWISNEASRNTDQALYVLKHLLAFAEYQYGVASPGQEYRERPDGDRVSNFIADIELWQILSTLGNRLYNLRTSDSYREAESYFVKARDTLEPWRLLIERRDRDDTRVHKILEMLSITERYLADLYASQSRFIEAESHCSACLAFAKMIEGENHTLELFKALRTYGYLQDRQSKYDDAIFYFEKAYICVSEAYGPVHPRVQEAAGYLTDSLLQSKNYSRAEGYARINYESLVDPLNGIDPDCFDVARGAQQLVHICCLTPQDPCLETVSFEEGEFLARKALRIVQTVFDPDHINIGSSLDDLGKVLFLSGNLGEETKQLFKRTLSIYLKCEGCDGVLVMGANGILGSFHFQRSEKNTSAVGKEVDLRSALHYYEEALRISSAVNGRDHPTTEEFKEKIIALRS